MYCVNQISPHDWEVFSENAHLIVFEKKRPGHLDRIDYALVVTDDKDTLLGYLTAKELDAESVYWQYGGAFPTAKGNVHAARGYGAFVEWARGRYKRVSTLVENTNVRYLKLAMAHGFRVNGVKIMKSKILVEMLLEFENRA